MNYWLLGFLYIIICLGLGIVGGGIAFWIQAIKRARSAPGHIHSEIKKERA